MRMPFGRHAGEPLENLPTLYLRWLLTIELRPWLAYGVRRELARRTSRARPDDDDDAYDAGRQSAPPPRADRHPPAKQDADDLIGAGLRTLAKKHHPDVGGSLERMQAFTAVADWLRRLCQERLR